MDTETKPQASRRHTSEVHLRHGLGLMTAANEALKEQLAGEKQARKALERELAVWQEHGGLPPGEAGDWMSTCSGRTFWPLRPDPADIEIRDIASALAKVCRFGGHTSQFYSVAEHSCRVYRMVAGETDDPRILRGALLHDASEAYIGDMIRPLKRFMPAFRKVEQGIVDAVAVRFDCDFESPLIWKWDDALLGVEGRDLCPGDGEWYKRYLVGTWSKMDIDETLDWEAAEGWFLECWESLTTDGH